MPKPLICFYDENRYIYSTHYKLLSCPNEQTVDAFLEDIRQAHPNSLKVVQLSFECFNEDLFQHQNILYPCPKANVFVLESFEFRDYSELGDTPSTPGYRHNLVCLMSDAEFIEKVNTTKLNISKGRIYQVNLTSAFEAECRENSETFFNENIRKFNPKYPALLPLKDSDVICFSPELFLNKRADILLTRPIKGSIKGDQSNNNLLKSEKEEAELSMIVDLLRNDFNAVEQSEAAAVNRHRELMDLGYVKHTYSEVQIVTRRSLSEILRHTFPGGSISGCPKQESLKVIAELENYKRQVYTGAIGWWHEDDFSLNVAIRTFIRYADKLIYHAGCGIVYDSQAEQELVELHAKTAGQT